LDTLPDFIENRFMNSRPPMFDFIFDIDYTGAEMLVNGQLHMLI
jgi:hypothetical protein